MRDKAQEGEQAEHTPVCEHCEPPQQRGRSDSQPFPPPQSRERVWVCETRRKEVSKRSIHQYVSIAN